MKGSVYISGPITGTEDYLERFSMAEVMITKAGYLPVNPAYICDLLPKNLSHEQYMSIDLPLLRLCDVVYFLKGWEESKGCRTELNEAISHRKTIVFEK